MAGYNNSNKGFEDFPSVSCILAEVSFVSLNKSSDTPFLTESFVILPVSFIEPVIKEPCSAFFTPVMLAVSLSFVTAVVAFAFN